MYFCLVNTGASSARRSATCWRDLSCCFWLPCSSVSIWLKSSTSKLKRKRRARPHHRVRWHQLRMREALVDVLVDDVRLIEDQIALDQHRQPVVGVHHRDVLGLVVHVDVDDLKVHALLVEHDAAALRERAGGSGVEVHHGGLPCCRIRRRCGDEKGAGAEPPRPLWTKVLQCTSFQNSL